MNLFKSFISLIVSFALVGCGAYQYATATKASDKATKEQQEQVKQTVMKLLEEEYQQPFKLESFDYKYKRHWVDNTCQMSFCKMEKYGTYYFKVQAVDNPIIVMDFKIDDSSKESIKALIDSFKKNQLRNVYCIGLIDYYNNKINHNKKVLQPYTEQAERVCNNIGKYDYKKYKNYYLKHQDEYK